MSSKEEEGPFAIILAIVGFFAGIAAGQETNLEGMGVFIFAIIMSAIGFGVGNLVDKVVAWLLFILVSLIMFLVNSAIRRFIWEIISAS